MFQQRLQIFQKAEEKRHQLNASLNKYKEEVKQNHQAYDQQQFNVQRRDQKHQSFKQRRELLEKYQLSLDINPVDASKSSSVERIPTDLRQFYYRQPDIENNSKNMNQTSSSQQSMIKNDLHQQNMIESRQSQSEDELSFSKSKLDNQLDNQQLKESTLKINNPFESSSFMQYTQTQQLDGYNKTQTQVEKNFNSQVASLQESSNIQPLSYTQEKSIDSYFEESAKKFQTLQNTVDQRQHISIQEEIYEEIYDEESLSNPTSKKLNQTPVCESIDQSSQIQETTQRWGEQQVIPINTAQFMEPKKETDQLINKSMEASQSVVNGSEKSLNKSSALQDNISGIKKGIESNRQKSPYKSPIRSPERSIERSFEKNVDMDVEKKGERSAQRSQESSQLNISQEQYDHLLKSGTKQSFELSQEQIKPQQIQEKANLLQQDNSQEIQIPKIKIEKQPNLIKKLSHELYVDADQLESSNILKSINRTQIFQLEEKYLEYKVSIQNQEILSIFRALKDQYDEQEYEREQQELLRKQKQVYCDQLINFSQEYITYRTGNLLKEILKEFRVVQQVIMMQDRLNYKIQSLVLSKLRKYKDRQLQKYEKDRIVRQFRFNQVINQQGLILQALQTYKNERQDIQKQVIKAMQIFRNRIIINRWKAKTYSKKLNYQALLQYKNSLFDAWRKVISKSIKEKDRKALKYFYFTKIRKYFNKLKIYSYQKKKTKLKFYTAKQQVNLLRKKYYFDKLIDFTNLMKREKEFESYAKQSNEYLTLKIGLQPTKMKLYNFQ